MLSNSNTKPARFRFTMGLLASAAFLLSGVGTAAYASDQAAFPTKSVTIVAPFRLAPLSITSDASWVQSLVKNGKFLS